jgi:YbbR domain-containing protein
VIRAADITRFLQNLLRRNLWLKAIALGLAVALWWFVAGESKVQVGFIVPLEIRNIPSGLTITNKVDRQVEVRLAGPPSLLGTLKPSDINAAIDLTGSKPGKHVIPVDDRSIRVPPGIKVQRIYPDTVEVSLERLERRSLPVVARFVGGAEARRRISKIEIVPSSLDVEALPEDFFRLKSLSAIVVIPETGSENFTENVRVELREGHARIVGDPIVRVTILFRK